MNHQIVTQTRQTALVVRLPANPHAAYRPFFDLDRAASQVLAHCKNLPAEKLFRKNHPTSDKDGPTMHVYRRALTLFTAFLDEYQALPTMEVLEQFLGAELSHLTSSTQGAYLAPIRRFCKNLSRQSLEYAQAAAAGLDAFKLMNLQQEIAAASEIRSPGADVTNYEAPILHSDRRKSGQSATWLTLDEVLALLKSINRDTLAGLRDYALLVVAFNTALRVAELSRLTLDSFKEADRINKVMKVTVRGKRNNMTPVPAPTHAYDILCQYVAAYNAAVPEDRRIRRDEPLWRWIDKADHPATDWSRPRSEWCLSTRSITNVVNSRSRAFNPSLNLSPHDLRRTAALIAFSRGMPMKSIQQMLRHQSVSTTEKYLGDGWRDYTTATLTTYDVVIA